MREEWPTTVWVRDHLLPRLRSPSTFSRSSGSMQTVPGWKASMHSVQNACAQTQSIRQKRPETEGRQMPVESHVFALSALAEVVLARLLQHGRVAARAVHQLL